MNSPEYEATQKISQLTQLASRDIGTTVRDRHNLISMWLSQNTSRKVKGFSEDKRLSFRGLFASSL